MHDAIAYIVLYGAIGLAIGWFCGAVHGVGHAHKRIVECLNKRGYYSLDAQWRVVGRVEKQPEEAE